MVLSILIIGEWIGAVAARDWLRQAAPVNQWTFSTLAKVSPAAAVEDVIADLSSSLQRWSPKWVHPDCVIVRCSASCVAKRYFACEYLSRKLLGCQPGGLLTWAIESAVASEGELANAPIRAFIDHGTNGMTIILLVQPMKHDFSDGLLPIASFATGLVIERLG